VIVTRAILLTFCLMLAGCGTDTVTLRHPESGLIVKCSDARGDKSQAQCIRDFEGQGFEKVPG
jgi:hypothetical protein